MHITYFELVMFVFQLAHMPPMFVPFDLFLFRSWGKKITVMSLAWLP